jgi:DNA-binding NarL/FixJ family response regulator
MPEIDGIEAARIISEKCNTPIIGITSHRDKETLDRCFAVGMKKVFKKPLLADQIVKIIKKWRKNKNEKMIGPRYKIYKNSENVILSRRKAECLACLLCGKTIRATSEVLGISLRTAEYYISSIRKGLNCVGKEDLISKIEKSDFRETAADIFKQIV